MAVMKRKHCTEASDGKKKKFEKNNNNNNVSIGENSKFHTFILFFALDQFQYIPLGEVLRSTGMNRFLVISYLIRLFRVMRRTFDTHVKPKCFQNVTLER